MKFRNLIAALGMLSLSSAGAMAADLAFKAPPPAAPVMSWTGFYLGAYGGAGFATWESSINFGGGAFPGSSRNLNGFEAGGQIGYNWQNGNFLMGLEGDGGWANVKGTGPCFVFLSCTANVRWTADATVRLGVLPMSNLLLYVKGGVAWAGVNDSFTSSFAGPGFSGSQDLTKVGGLIGFGTEYMFMPHWSAKIEYNFADFGNHTDNFTVPGGTVPVQTSLMMHTVKAGVNYHF